MTKISSLTLLPGTAADSAVDILPIVDMSEVGANRNKKITIAELATAMSSGGGYATRAAIAAIGSPVANASVILTEAGRFGVFVFNSANLSAKVTGDPAQGIYVAPASNATGASGAWVRNFSGPVDATWFGALGNNVANDTVGLQAAFDYVCAPSNPNSELHIRAGIYNVTNIKITASRGITIRGEGRLKTTIRATSTSPALSINGLWFSRIEGIAFDSLNALIGQGVVEQDGNYDGVNVQGTQGITWADCWFDGRGLSSGGLSPYSFIMNRRGGSAAQGSECLFLNCHWLGASEACYHQFGFNALNNTIVGGNFQVYSKHAAQAIGGVINFYSVGFQSTLGYNQILNDGFDIDVGSVGAFEGIIVSGCRTESLRFIRSANANRPDVRACVGVLSLTPWTANTPFGLNAGQGKAVKVASLKKVFLATTEGTSGATEPVWPTDGVSTVADGTIVWKELIFDFIDVSRGTVDRATCGSDAGRIKSPETQSLKLVSANYKVDPADNFIMVDATAGPISITFPGDGGPAAGIQVRQGHVITVKKVDASANDVTINSPVIGFENGTGQHIIPGGAAGSRTFVHADVTGGATRWALVSKV